MSEIYRVPPWIMQEYWELKHDPNNKPNVFTVIIFGQPVGAIQGSPSYEGKGVSISHAAKNAYKKRLKNDTQIPAEGQILPPENQATLDKSPETEQLG